MDDLPIVEADIHDAGPIRDLMGRLRLRAAAMFAEPLTRDERFTAIFQSLLPKKEKGRLRLALCLRQPFSLSKGGC